MEKKKPVSNNMYNDAKILKYFSLRLVQIYFEVFCLPMHRSGAEDFRQSLITVHLRGKNPTNL